MAHRDPADRWRSAELAHPDTTRGGVNHYILNGFSIDVEHEQYSVRGLNCHG
ncbi:hypothetical protein CDL15_Pgr007139 [Punica granatum]|uniref:Uncharacterized protein n=1 Tax=Punica granatum TaxID=22663 RepID=A0A218X8I5_PUNGR|nr:hypothetical protein CDL15_Pgr007139 [Punica granatum]